ncbi:MAG TPA: hypothetical protein VGH42_09670 [Verrucomicrobiae bacterium]|jgi:hypothetical protein
MKDAIAILFAALVLCGCNKPAAPALEPKQVRWEYKMITIENNAHGEATRASQKNPMDIEMYDGALSDSGSFDLDELDAATKEHPELFSVDRAGKDGWELVSAIPQIETIAGAKFISGTDYDPASGKVTPHKEIFSNTRTGKIVLIFKRPLQ